MTDIIYEDYPYTNGERKDEVLNKRIVSLARRHKFYLKQVQNVLKPTGWTFHRKSYQVIVAKKPNKKGNDYKVVGFIMYDGNTLWGRRGDRMCTSMEYSLVDKKFQGQGVGKRLFGDSLGLKNYCVMYDKTNEKLHNLYTSLGYTLIPKWDGEEVDR